MPAIASPCVQICGMDDASGWCRGCGRTIGEIARWGSTDAADRAAILAELPARMTQLSAARPAGG